MRRRITSTIAVPVATLMLLAAAGCSGGGDSATGGEEGQQASPQQWFEENCPLKFSNTDSDGKLAMIQGPIAMNPQAIDEEYREDALKLYSYDESTASAEQAGELGSDTPFCFKANQETVEGSNPEADSPEDIKLYPVSMPDSDSVYIARDWGEEDGIDGIAFDTEEKYLIGADGYEATAQPIAIPDQLADIDGAMSNASGDVEYCNLVGSLCGG